MAILAVGVDAIRGSEAVRSGRARYSVLGAATLTVGARRLVRSVCATVRRLAGAWLTGAPDPSPPRRTATERRVVELSATGPVRVWRRRPSAAQVLVTAVVARVAVSRVPGPSTADRAAAQVARACRGVAGWVRREFVDQWQFGLASLAGVGALWVWIWTAI